MAGTALPEEATRLPEDAGGAWSSAAGPVPSLGTASASAPERSAAGCPATSLAGSGTTSTTMSLDCRASAESGSFADRLSCRLPGSSGVFGKQDPFAALVGGRPPDRPAAVEDGDRGMGFRPAGDHGVALRVDADDVEGGRGSWREAWKPPVVCGAAAALPAARAAPRLGRAASAWAVVLACGETGAVRAATSGWSA